MAPSRPLACLAVLLAGVGLGACGDDDADGRQREKGREPQPTPGDQRQRLEDPRGDVLVKPPAPARKVTRAQLDLLDVTLGRDRGGITVSFVTAAPPGPGMLQVVEVYDLRQLVEAPIEIRYRRDGEVRAVARPPRGTFKRVSVKVVGREATVRVPLNEYTRKPVFKWRAYTVSTHPTSEIRDRVPHGEHNVAIFPTTTAVCLPPRCRSLQLAHLLVWQSVDAPTVSTAACRPLGASGDVCAAGA